MCNTPEFIRWSIPGDCSLREEIDPQRTERELRPLRAFSEAAAANRLFEGICVCELPLSEPVAPDEVKGFSAKEILDAYGGQDYVQSQCGDCPINAIQKKEPNGLAGCYGLFSFGEIKSDLFESLNRSIDETLADQWKRVFLPTDPPWYGLWADSPLSQAQIELLHQLLNQLSADNDSLAEHLKGISAAAETALSAKAPLHVTLVPQGRVEGEYWIVASHCPQCKAGWPKGKRVCGVCKHHGHPLPSRKRHVRGDRPYWRLERFLGKEKAASFFLRYQNYRKSVLEENDLSATES